MRAPQFTISFTFALALTLNSARPHPDCHHNGREASVPPVATWTEHGVWDGGMVVGLVLSGIPPENDVRFCFRWRDHLNPWFIGKTWNFEIRNVSSSPDKFCGRTKHASRDLGFIASNNGAVPARPYRFRIAGTVAKIVFASTTASNSPVPNQTDGPVPRRTTLPKMSPSATPSFWPTPSPVENPTARPTNGPAKEPNSLPTEKPTMVPIPTNQPPRSPATDSPASDPSIAPSMAPTFIPNQDPTPAPTAKPTGVPTRAPSIAPPASRTKKPTTSPRPSPTRQPTMTPDSSPVTSPMAGGPSPVQTPEDAGDGPFKIFITYDDDHPLTTKQRRIFDKAAARWETVITNRYKRRTVEDYDIQILALARSIDGEFNILGQAGPTGLNRHAGFLPDEAIMDFDIDDLDRMQGDETLQAVIEHEMGHCLGFGTLWQLKDLVVGEGSAEPAFRGAMAVREYNALTGNSGNVPLENTGGRGTRDSHWREETFHNELMTGFISQNDTQLSRLTVASFGDLGYPVNLDKADEYSDPIDQGSSVQDAENVFYCNACYMKHTAVSLLTKKYPL